VHTNPKEPRKAHSNIAEAASQNKQSLKNIAQAAGQDKTKSLSQDRCSRTWTNTNNPQDHHYRQKRNWKKNQTNLSRSSSRLQIQLVHKRRICYNM
jgi:hypothetical protein